MKYFKIISITLSVLFLAGCSKDFLSKVPPDKLSEDGFVNSPARLLAEVNNVYVPLQNSSMYSDYLPKFESAPAGEILLSNTQPYQLNNFSYDPADTYSLNIYAILYTGVKNANSVIDAAPGVSMDATLKARYVGEAKFLRAFYYWTLTTLYGDVPLFTTSLKNTDDALVARTPIADVYKFIIKDLQDAAAGLPVSYGSSDKGRITKGAAQAMLGKVYLYNKDYVNAELLLGQVKDSGTYGLMDDFSQVWNRNFENNKESIFEVQFADIGGSGTGSRNGAYMPGVNGGTGSSLATQLIHDAFTGNDPRLGYSIWQEGDTFAPDLTTSNLNLDTYKSSWVAKGLYNIKKGMVPVKYTGGSGTNYPVIRFADVLLMYAEAANELGLIDKARDAVNKVRQRPSVNMPVLTSANTGTKAAMFDAIVHERQVELAFENHRFNDLRRWGLAEKELGALGYKSKHRYFPIPQLEIDLNPKLIQNPGW